MNLGTDLPGVDDPVEILDGIVAKRREMLMGMKGNKKVDLENFEKNIEPKLFTMSLSGEPTLYPRLGEMFVEIRRRGAVSFLVTNGLNPDVLRRLESEGLPTQLVISTNAPNEALWNKWHRSMKKDAWETFLESLDVMRELRGKVRRVIRLTVVKKGEEGEFGGMMNMSDENVGEYCELIRRASPDFVHVKGYKAVGYARERMGYDSQVWHDEVKSYAERLAGELEGYSIKAEDERSCVVCVARDGVGLRITTL
jgi:tRNA wybutosine-synthesizing protein 1